MSLSISLCLSLSLCVRCDIFNRQQRKLKRGRRGCWRQISHACNSICKWRSSCSCSCSLSTATTHTHTQTTHTHTIRCVAVPMKMKMFANQKASLPSFSYSTQRKRVREEVVERRGVERKRGCPAHTEGDCIEVYTIVTRIHFKRFMRSLLLFLLPAARSLWHSFCWPFSGHTHTHTRTQ